MEETGQNPPDGLSFVEGVAWYFKTASPMGEPSFETISSLARTVYQRYLNPTAYDACEYEDRRNPQLYGPHGAPAPAPAGADNAQSGWTGDTVLMNNVAFMRLTFWYLEMCMATAEGDIGRVYEIMKVSSRLTLSVHISTGIH